MNLSVKLLVATLGVSQFSGVVGSKKERDQLRRNLRQGERKAQFMFTDPGLDDFFELPEEVEGVGIAEFDDYFKETDSGMVYDWDAKEEVSGDAVVREAPVPAEEYTGKSGKSTKIGKQMWSETPVGKSAKKAKVVADLKSMKASIKGAKGALLYQAKASKSSGSASTKYDSRGQFDYYASESYDTVEEESTDGWLSAFESTGGNTYSSLFGTTTEVTETHDFSDPGHVTASEFKAAGGSTLMTSRMEDPSARMDTYDDDYFNPEERLVFLPRPTVTLGGSLFSVNPQTIIAPIVPDGSGNTLTLGTEYLFNEIMTNAQDIGSQIAPIDVDSEQVLFVVALDGICDRTGPADQNSVQGYCFFTYTFIDPATQLTAGSFTAQGIIVNSQVPGQLTVTGGTGIMTGAAGLVEVLPAAVDQNVNPPELIQPAAGLDPFNEIAGWAHFFEFDVDVLFFLPELYAR